MTPPPPRSTLFPYTTLFRSNGIEGTVAVTSRKAYRFLSAGTMVEDLYRSEEHTSELQSHVNLVCRLLLEKKKNNLTSLPDIAVTRAIRHTVATASMTPPLCF